MGVIYLDHAATANPKAPGVGPAMLRSLGDCNGNPGHGAHRLSVAATLAVYEARATLAELLGVRDPGRLAFTAGATAALNQAIRGSLPEHGGHAICSVWEHNAVLRPLLEWRRRSGGTITFLPPGPDGAPFRPADLERAIQADTALIALSAASNVTGAIAPVAEAGEIARARGVRLLVDGSQAAGHLPVALDRLPVDLWACPGHKGLLGPQGVGLLYLREGLELPPLVVGGGGFDSAREDPPDEAPERYEAGTQNTPGILGLGAAAAHLLRQDPHAARAREVRHLDALQRGLGRIAGVRLHGAADPRRCVGVLSFAVAGWAPGAVAETLDRRFGICVRAGLHCAPMAHEALGTLPAGTVRASVGPWTTDDDLAALPEAVAWIAARAPEIAAPAEAARGA